MLAPCVTFSPFPADYVAPLPGPVADLQDASFAELSFVTLAPLLADLQACRVSADGGVTFKSGRRHERPLKSGHPSEPATITVGNVVIGEGRLLVADFDVAKAEIAGHPDPRGLVAAEAAEFVALIERCGGRAIHDISPSGGRHVYVRFRRMRPWEDIRRIARALDARFTTFDKTPLNGPKAQIRPPGAAHKRSVLHISRAGKGAARRTGPLSGYLTLTMPLDQALEVLQRPCAMSVWERLETELRAELGDVDGQAATFDAPAGGGVWSIDPAGSPWLQPRGGRRALPPRLAQIAASGSWSDYDSPSEARIAVLNSAAAAGWKLAEVRTETRPGGAFAGLEALLGTRTPAQRKAVMTFDWGRAVTAIADYRATLRKRHNPVRNSDTSPIDSTRPPTPHGQHWSIQESLATAPPMNPSVWHNLYRWAGAVWYAERDPVRSKVWGRHSCSVRLALRGLLVAARLKGDLSIDFGVRSLSLASGLSRTTVAEVLELLRDEDDPLIDLVMRGASEDADVYQLRIPDAYRAEAVKRPWRAGRIEAGHPAFRKLGPVCALLYEALSSKAAPFGQVVKDAVLSSSATADGLSELARHGLAVRDPAAPQADDPAERLGGWRRGPDTLDDVAARGEVGGFEQFKARVLEYQTDRKEWHEFLGLMGDPDAWRTVIENNEEQAPPADAAAAGSNPVDLHECDSIGTEIHPSPATSMARRPRSRIRRRPVQTQAEALRPADVDEVLAHAAGQHGAPEEWTLPPDVAAADRADFLAELHDQPAPHEYAELEQALREFDDDRAHDDGHPPAKTAPD